MSITRHSRINKTRKGIAMTQNERQLISAHIAEMERDLLAWQKRSSDFVSGALDKVELALQKMNVRRAAARERLNDLSRDELVDLLSDFYAGLEIGDERTAA